MDTARRPLKFAHGHQFAVAPGRLDGLFIQFKLNVSFG
jgi:hypothetical protein